MDTIADELLSEDTQSPEFKMGVCIGLLRDLIEANEKDHKKIFERLDENDKNTVVLKLSRCAFSWLDKNGLIKWGVLASFGLVMDYFIRHSI
jgi:hypothetical protein